MTLRYGGAMTEQTEAATPVATPELEIEFEGRQIWVRMPSPEQLLVWKRTLTQLQGADVTGWNGEQVMKALERTRMRARTAASPGRNPGPCRRHAHLRDRGHDRARGRLAP